MIPKHLDRRPIVANWLWWATFAAGVRMGVGVHDAGVAARNAVKVLWDGSP